MSNIIKSIRSLRGYTQKDLASKMEMSPRTYCVKEKNPDTFSVLEIRRLAEVLSVKEEVFFGKEVTVKAT